MERSLPEVSKCSNSIYTQNFSFLQAKDPPVQSDCRHLSSKKRDFAGPSRLYGTQVRFQSVRWASVILFPVPWVQIALKSFHPFGFLEKINAGRFAQILSSPWTGFRPRWDRKIFWYKINSAGTWRTRIICYTLRQSKRPGTEVNGTDWPHPKRSIRNGIIKKTASNGCQLGDKSIHAMPLQALSVCNYFS